MGNNEASEPSEVPAKYVKGTDQYSETLISFFVMLACRKEREEKEGCGVWMEHKTDFSIRQKQKIKTQKKNIQNKNNQRTTEQTVSSRLQIIQQGKLDSSS